jgi:hypothetical protein
MWNTKTRAIAIGAIAAAACTGERDPTLGEVASAISSGAKRAATGSSCSEADDNNATQDDCLTIENAWTEAGARPVDVQNAARTLVYTGIDELQDDDLIATETSFARGFRTSGGRAMGSVYGAHGNPGRIQGLPSFRTGSILNESFGGKNIPWLGLSVCWAGNAGAYATTGQLRRSTPATYQNNLAAAPWITEYYDIPTSAIIACRNGTVRPSETTLWCTQKKIQRDGWAQPRKAGNATLIQGDGTPRGAATTKEMEDDATGDFSFEMQPEGPDEDMDGRPDYPARYFKARNLSSTRGRNGGGATPWELEERCACTDGICTVQDNYPAVLFSMIAKSPVPGGSGSAGGSMTGLYVFLFGRFLTTSIQIEQPDGSLVEVTQPTAGDDGSFASFSFQPTQSGVHYIRLTDLDDLHNDPKDPAFPYEQFIVTPGDVGGGGGDGSGSGGDGSGSGSGGDGGGGSGGGGGDGSGSGIAIGSDSPPLRLP